MSGVVLRQGLDLTEVARIEAMLERHPERFPGRCFTEGELRAADGFGGQRRVEYLAGRFAAKEAASKALGTGIADGVGWTDIEVLTAPTGEPTLRLHRGAAIRAEGLGTTVWAVSITHAAGLAIAVVTGIGSEGG